MNPAIPKSDCGFITTSVRGSFDRFLPFCLLLFMSAFMVTSAPLTVAAAQTSELTLILRTRDPNTNELITTPKRIDTKKIGIIIIDPWNYHWCMTWAEQARGMTPRMNKALEGARKLGMQIFWAPTDAASMFSGWPQRQRAMAVPYVDVPKARELTCKFTVPFGKCLCGPGINCITNYGWDGMVAQLVIAEQIQKDQQHPQGQVKQITCEGVLLFLFLLLCRGGISHRP